MNWKQIISDLSDRGYTQPKLAEACGCGQATISDMATGKTKSPRYEVGAKLLKILEGMPQTSVVQLQGEQGVSNG
ncbi:helix-turn-helix transcriptional regulator [Limnohabitans sp.]|uniref:helix-turn-helix domain-containing protein n=1 Tax=Limnohabitans sp. TaxID=1907725 RepID=UPI00286F60F1|nr:helix-turn-helix transcriptional regulator [Limnohabitans sp.]